MSIRLHKLSTKDAHYQSAENLMLLSFPPEERRPVEKQREITDNNTKFNYMAVLNDNKFIGLITYWNLGDFVYIEHLATEPEVRGGGTGGLILKLLAESITMPVVLEVEPPTNEIAERRINFYKRNGYSLWDNFKYIQPAYDNHLPDVPLILMVKGTSNSELTFEHFREEIHINVYGKEKAVI